MEIVDGNVLFGYDPRSDQDFSVDRLLRLMGANGISRALAVSMRGVLYDYAEGNAETLEVARQHSEIIPVATADPRRYYRSEGVVRRCKDEGFKIFRLFNKIQDWPLEFSPFFDILEELNEEEMPLMIDAWELSSATRLSEILRDFSPPVVLTSARYMNLSEVISVCRRRPNFYVETHELAGPDAMEIVVGELGADRLIYGSMMMVNYPLSSLFLLKEAEISEEDREAIASRNILRILGDL
ncbi:MAG: amidohydrolase family protein [bacterium]